MANEATIDELQIEIEAESGAAASNLEKLAQALDRLEAVTQRISSGNDGLNKVAKQINKLNTISQKIQSMQGFEKLGQMVDQLKRLDELNSVGDLSGLTRSLSAIARASSSIGSVDMNALSTNLQGLASALQPLSAIQGTGDISGVINALGRLPRVAAGLSQMDMGTFAQQMQQVTAAVQPFVAQMQTLSGAFGGLPAPVQQAVASLTSYNVHVQNAQAATAGLSKTLKLVNFMAAYSIIKRITGYFSEFIESSNSYVENLNLFTVTMGSAADEALDFANAVNEAMGIDVSQWIQNQGIFKQMASGFGMVEEKANLLSKNLTQLGYDISLYYNITADAAMQKLQSAMAGEQEPLRRLGYALDEATLKQVALNHGITESISNMSQAQKAQLRYIAIMEQSKNAIGDMARTIDSPANQLRILESRIETLKRTIGDSLMPVISAALPYVTAFFQILGEAFRNLAAFMGFELPVFDYSDLMTKQNENIASSFDEATAASNKFKGSLSSIDQLNIIGSDSDSSGSAGDPFGADLNLDLPSYDFLGNLEAETTEAYNTLKGFLDKIGPVVAGIAATLGTLFVGDKIISGLKAIKEGFDFLTKTPLGKVAATIGAVVAAFLGFKNIVKDLTTGNGSLGKLALAIGGVTAAAITFIATGNPVGAVLTVLAAGVGALVGYEAGLREINAQIADTIMYADRGGISLDGLADGFSSYIYAVSSGYSDILDNSRAMQENRDKIADAADAIYNLTDKYRILGGEISAENAETMRANIETIGNAVSENLGTFTQGIVESLKGTFHDFAVQLGLDVDDMVGKFYLLESMGNTALAGFKKQAQDIVTEITSGSLSAEEMTQKLNELDDVVKKMSGSTNATAESVGFTRALQNMDFAGIDFNDENSVKRILSDFTAQAEAARASINEAWNSQVVDLMNTKQQYINLGVDVEFDTKFGTGAFDKLFSDAEDVLNTGYKTELAKIDAGMGVFLAMVQDQLNQNIAEAARATSPTFGDYLGANLSNLITFKGINTDLMDDKAEASNVKRITEQFAGVQEAIDNAANGLDLSAYYDAGRYLTDGMAGGAIDGQEGLNTALTAIATGGLDALEKEFEINSPSKKTEEMGGYLMEGLVLGIENNTALVLGAMDTLYEQMRKRQEEFKKQWEKFSLDNYSADDFIPDLGIAYTTGVKPSNTSGVVGVAREAYNSGTQTGGSAGTPVEMTINLQSYVELDGEQVGHAAAQYQQQQILYTNGR